MALSEAGACWEGGSTSRTLNEADMRSETGLEASYVSFAVWNLMCGRGAEEGV